MASHGVWPCDVARLLDLRRKIKVRGAGRGEQGELGGRLASRPTATAHRRELGAARTGALALGQPVGDHPHRCAIALGTLGGELEKAVTEVVVFEVLRREIFLDCAPGEWVTWGRDRDGVAGRLAISMQRRTLCAGRAGQPLEGRQRAVLRAP